MKIFRQFILPALLVLMTSNLPAEETKPETAWDNETGQITGGSKYAFGSITLPPDFFSQIYRTGNTSADDDPFGDDTAQKLAFRKHPPILPAGQAPLCLPKGVLYYDVSKILNENGLSIKPPEWALVSGGLSGSNQLYFCTTWMNTDLIHAILMSIHGCGPRSITLHTNVVSVENQGLQNIAWTSEKIASLHPKFHTSHGTNCRSGERSTLIIKSPSAYGISKYDVTLGENNRNFDCHLELNLKLPGKSAVKINLKSAITGEIGTPLIIDCGTHGIDQRNYLLVIHSRVDSTDSKTFQNYKIIKPLDKIEGIYALRNGEAAEQPKLPLETLRYQVDKNFLNLLREAMSNQGGEVASNKALTPILVKNTPIPFKHQKSDRIFDITAALRHLGSHTFIGDKRERFLYNKSQHQLIIHACPTTRESVLLLYSSIRPNIRMIRMNARIVSADTQGEPLSTWTIEEIEKRNPQPLANYSITAQSGEVSTSGKTTKKTTTKNKKTGETTTHITHEFEIETTIGEQNRIIDTRIAISSQPLGPKKITLEFTTSLTLTDGKPTIIELGHPASSTRTHLLILNADLILPNGTFYRNCLTPIK